MAILLARHRAKAQAPNDDFQRVSVHEGSHAPAAVEARKFRARAARLVAANYTHRFAACDTSRFYPNATRNEVL